MEIEAKVDNLEAPLVAASAKNNELESHVEGLTAKLAAARKETEKLQAQVAEWVRRSALAAELDALRCD